MDISKCKKGLWMTTDLKRAVSSSVRVLFSHRTFFKGLSKSYAFSLFHFHDDFLRFFFIRNNCGFGLLYVIQKMIYLAVFCRASKSTKGRTNGMQWRSYHQYQVLYILRLSPIAEQREGRWPQKCFLKKKCRTHKRCWKTKMLLILLKKQRDNEIGTPRYLISQQINVQYLKIVRLLKIPSSTLAVIPYAEFVFFYAEEKNRRWLTFPICRKETIIL